MTSYYHYCLFITKFSQAYICTNIASDGTKYFSVCHIINRHKKSKFLQSVMDVEYPKTIEQVKNVGIEKVLNLLDHVDVSKD